MQLKQLTFSWVTKGALIALVLSLAACSGQKNKKPQPPQAPVSNQALLIESPNDSEVLLRVTGKGKSVNSAKIDAQKTAIWYLLLAGDYPLLNSEQAKLNFEKFSADYWGNPSQYLRYVSDIKGKRQEGQYKLIDLLVRVDKKTLKQSLLSKNILVEVSQDQLPTFIVTASSEILKQKITQSLKTSGYQVLSETGQSKERQLISDLADLEGIADPEYQHALATGADVILTATNDLNSQVVSQVKTASQHVSIEVIDSVSNLNLASSVGNSSIRKASEAVLLQEAANDAIYKMQAQLNQTWLKQAEEGQLYKVILMTDELTEETDFSFFDALKNLKHEEIKRLKAGTQIVSYWVWSNDYDSLFDLYRNLKTSYKGQGELLKQLENGRFLVLKLETDNAMIIQ